MIKTLYQMVQRNISAACKNSGRSTEDVTLIAVSKTKPIPKLEEAYQLGIRDFGENKVQELVEKYEALPKDIRWHMIGHLQRNKVKYIIDKVSLIHSVDSIKLAREIEKEGKKHNLRMPVLIEVNVAREESKFGLYPEELDDFFDEVRQFQHIEIKGLMTIAPYVHNPEENRGVFQELRKISVDISMKNLDNTDMSILSMGMTGDYMVAIEEGASMVRVGTGLFGEREYTLHEEIEE
ncbi:pyridoxal phosphate enzyme (YggS family) [Aequitasia blattaphilus]|uniref:Pyridoxal phosphate homeostasis protein n=1 Tax=Aequitasia blattaphilus TaxID=2949332 RepID=A0ABT1E793_9FIRM|nr:YggS family pyridoxal phosphate-dependent enzyme [Aequitasia blattaphilus]MCP1101701.1 YggS family pyridoxal phosphate-dependent enzyme [Aequitasia blattaphilus]MCR8614341.1 YggS family pyridoxal phosphate-dependent enzyme [Aequitasia blattaphilus]